MRKSKYFDQKLQNKKKTFFPASKSITTTQPGADLKTNRSQRSQRETRHIRMFKVIICLIAVFLVCRLPNWIFLLIKLHNDLRDHMWWILQYSLGILALCNCMVNPLLYTFLGETLKFGEWLRARACAWWCCHCTKRPSGATEIVTTPESSDNKAAKEAPSQHTEKSVRF